RVHAQVLASFDAGLRRQPRHDLERGDELGTAVGVTAVVDRVHAEEHVTRADDLCVRQRERQEDRVAGGHVRHRDVFGIDVPALRYRDVVGERRPAEGAEVDVDDAVLAHTELPSDRGRRVELDGVPLAVAEAEGVHVETVPLGDGRRRRRVDTAGEQDHRGRNGHAPTIGSRARRRGTVKWRAVRADRSAVKKTVVALALVLTFLGVGGAALALTAGSGPAATDDSTSTSSTSSSTTAQSSDTAGSDTESSDVQSGDTGSDQTDATETESDDSGSDAPDSADTSSSHDHPDNHGASVSSAAHTCPHDSDHGKCVSAVAHQK